MAVLLVDAVLEAEMVTNTRQRGAAGGRKAWAVLTATQLEAGGGGTGERRLGYKVVQGAAE